MDIAEVSRRSGMAASALRFYEEQGLIRSVGRKGLRRVFDAGILPRLALIALGQRAGFSLAEIGGMLGSAGPPPRSLDREGGRDRPDDPANDRFTRRIAARRRMHRAHSYGVPSLQAPSARRIEATLVKAGGQIVFGRHGIARLSRNTVGTTFRERSVRQVPRGNDLS